MEEQANYIEAARLITKCDEERLPYLLAVLRQGGIEIPEPERHEPKKLDARRVVERAKTSRQGRRTTPVRIDNDAMMLCQSIRLETGLSLMQIATQLIKLGSEYLKEDVAQ